MAVPKEYLSHLAAEMAKRLNKSGKIKLPDPNVAAATIQQVFLNDSAREDQLNQEVRDYLQQYNEQIRRDNISYQEMYNMVKRELMKKYKMVHAAGRDRDGGKLSRDKMIELSHALTQSLALIPHVEFTVAQNDVRIEIMHELQALLKEEMAIDQAVRLKISSQKRTIEDGSAEWDILFRKYYSEEMRKLGVS